MNGAIYLAVLLYFRVNEMQLVEAHQLLGGLDQALHGVHRVIEHGAFVGAEFNLDDLLNAARAFAMVSFADGNLAPAEQQRQ